MDGIVTVIEGNSEYQFTSYSEAQKATKPKSQAGYTSINEPKFISPAEANLAGERVIGIWFRSGARAYPIRYMQSHQLCHDEINGRPLLVSYSPPAAAGAAFLRSLKDGEKQLVLEFSVAGRVASVGYTVIQDHQTKSLWNPFTGHCMAGPLKGSKLKRVSMLTTTWEHWKKLVPNTQVLAPVRTEYRSVVTDNSNSGSKYATNVSQACDPDAVGLGVLGSTQQLFVPLESLTSFRGDFIAGQLDGQQIVVLFDAANATAQAFYARTTQGDTVKLSLSKSSLGRYVAEDESVFDLLGRCRTGPLKGRQLAIVADATLTRWFAWNKTFPKSFVVQNRSK